MGYGKRKKTSYIGQHWVSKQQLISNVNLSSPDTEPSSMWGGLNYSCAYPKVWKQQTKGHPPGRCRLHQRGVASIGSMTAAKDMLPDFYSNIFRSFGTFMKRRCLFGTNNQRYRN
jgi:hypothetical protein